MIAIQDCKKYLGFDDRWLMLIGIPLLSIAMPYVLVFDPSYEGFSRHASFHSFFHVAIYWLAYRFTQIEMHKRYPAVQDSLKRNIIQFLIVLLTAPILKLLLNYSIDYLIHGFTDCPPEILPSTFGNILRIYFPCFMILAIYECTFYFSKYREELVRNERLEKIRAQSELQHLRNQVNPHFLFNSLNVLMNLIPVQPDAAMGFLDKLSRFYRYTVGAKEEELYSLQKELDIARLYADLLEERFRDALRFRFPEKAYKGIQVLPMSLQLLIENAIKHNIVSRSQPLNIDISISSDLKSLVICNNLQPKMEAVSGTGIGLSNIRKRLEFYTDQQLKIVHDKGQFCVYLPLLSTK